LLTFHHQIKRTGPVETAEAGEVTVETLAVAAASAAAAEVATALTGIVAAAASVAISAVASAAAVDAPRLPQREATSPRETETWVSHPVADFHVATSAQPGRRRHWRAGG
jgi:hypothetical protein